MTLRPEYSLGHSPFNPFLFAIVGMGRQAPANEGPNGEDGDGAGGDDVTVLSALTRLQVDPWREAQRLADLPPDVASTLLTATLGRLTDISWSTIDAETTARRLIALLPPAGVPDIPATQAAAAAQREGKQKARPAAIGLPTTAAKTGRFSWIGFAVLFVVALAIVLYLKPDNSFEPNFPDTRAPQSKGTQ